MPTTPASFAHILHCMQEVSNVQDQESMSPPKSAPKGIVRVLRFLDNDVTSISSIYFYLVYFLSSIFYI